MKPLAIKTFILIFVSTTACGRGEPVPSSARLHDDHSSSRLASEEVSIMGDKFGVLTEQYYASVASILSAEPPPCSASAELPTYLSAWAASGQSQLCVQYSQACLGGQLDLPLSARTQIAFAGARCAAALDQLATAKDLFDLAIAVPTPDAGVLLNYAMFTERSPYERETPAILARIGQLDGYGNSDVVTLQALLDYWQTGKSSLLTLSELEPLVAELMDRHPDGAALDDAGNTLWHSVLTRGAYRFSDALRFALQHMQSKGPERLHGRNWTNMLLRVINDLYSQPEGLKVAGQLYARYLPFAAADHELPTEKNPYTYQELYTEQCRANLTEGQMRTDYQELAQGWRYGQSQLPEVLAQAQALYQRSGEKADVLSLLGSLYEEQGDDDVAAGYYWRAHKACPYYNRAHWGLSGVRLRRWQTAFPDHDERLAAIWRSDAEVEFPSSLAQYVTNFTSLSADDQVRLRYSLRFWARHIDFLLSSGNLLYVKRGFERLSEAPGLRELADTRIDYPYDNRLWDDVRGLGGMTVVVDRSEMRGTAFGAFNLGAHEVAHQWHGAVAPAVQDCIKALYGNAKERGLFSDAYAATNEYEYFAQAVTYAMIQADAPRFYGLNSRWVRDHDPDLQQLLDAVASGQHSDIVCPVTLP